MGKRAYIEENKRWLKEKAKEADVKALDKGVYYKVIQAAPAEGNHPSPTSVVSVYYTGKLINGKVFDSSPDGPPTAFRLRNLIEGWLVALQAMTIGDLWEIYIPAEMGYGKVAQPDIPAGSTLIFTIELKAITG